MFSFQPAAFVGDERRWRDGYRDSTADDVWASVEAGAGTRLPFRALQTGDERCNRTTFGFYVGEDYFPVLDDEDEADLRTRDMFYRRLGGVDFAGSPLPVLAVRLLRVSLRHPEVVPAAVGWALRMLRRVGVIRLVRHRRMRPVTFVMHSFMDAADVMPAWAALRAGQTGEDPRIAATTQDRLRACAHTMAHPQTGELVPACAQHAVLDPDENSALRLLFPLTPVGTCDPAGTPVTAGAPGHAHPSDPALPDLLETLPRDARDAREAQRA